MATIAAAITGQYPERDEPREGKLDRALLAAKYVTGNLVTGTGRLSRIIPEVNKAAAGLDVLPEQEFPQRVAELRRNLRRDGFSSIALTGEAFAFVRVQQITKRFG